MDNSIYVALEKIPSGLSDVEKVISSAFSEFGIKKPLIKFNRNLHDEDLLKDFLQIEGKKRNISVGFLLMNALRIFMNVRTASTY